MLLAQTVSPEIVKSVLEAPPVHVLGLVAFMIAIVLLGVLAYMFRVQNNTQRIFDQHYEILSKTMDNIMEVVSTVAVLSDGLNKQNHAITHINNASDETILVLHRLDDTMKANLEVNKTRIEQNDRVRARVEEVHSGIQRLTDTFDDGKSSAVREVKEAIMDVVELIQTIVNTAQRIEERLSAPPVESEKLDLILQGLERLNQNMQDMMTLLNQQKPPTPPPIPVPEIPPMPPSPLFPMPPFKTDAMFLYETWNDTTLHYESDTAPRIRWVRANSVEGTQGLQNDARVASTIENFQGAKVLKLHADPDKYPQSLGVRVVLTDEKRWTALQPHAGKTLYIRYWLMWPELPVLDEQGGTAGRWCTAGFQIKDDPNISALYQMNVDASHKPFLTYRDGTEQKLAEVAYKANIWHRYDLVWKMTAGHDGSLDVAIDGVPAWKATGKSAAPSGFASFHLLLYTDALRKPAELLIGPVVMSTEPIV